MTSIHTKAGRVIKLSREGDDILKLLKGMMGWGVDVGYSTEERPLVEQEFRQGRLSVLVSTTTLAAGVSLPADVVILPDPRLLEFDHPGRAS